MPPPTVPEQRAVHPVDEKLPALKMATTGLQRVAAMYAVLDKDNNVLVVAVSLAVGIVPITAPEFYHAFPETAKIVLDSGISTGCGAAVLLNLVFNHLGKGRDAQHVTHPMEAGEEITGAPTRAPATP
ncbi:hypothetical protein GCM10010254_47870 [Streptomyces chromofuscus]|nr:hypothetical protein GCM10010254_47870 [Streptomyces chromofuscus]